MKRFKDGLLFGAGFGISFLLLSYLAAYILYPLLPTRLVSNEYPDSRARSSETTTEESRTPNDKNPSPGLAYHELPFDAQIDQAIAIVITKYEKGPDGLYKAMVVEYLKGAPTKEFPYKVGDEMTSQSYYAKIAESKGDGSVVFYIGRPDISQMSFQYDGTTLSSFGNMPLEVLRKKCEKGPDA